MLPLLIAAGGVAAVSALAQWYNSEQGRKASAAERERVKEMLDNVQSPNFDPAKLSPEQYAVVRKYVPKAASFVAEQAPQLVKADSAGAVAGRGAQMDALNRLRNLSASGTDEQSQLLQQEATNAANVANRGRQGAISEDFRNRGAGGSGLELLAQLTNAQGANEIQAQNSRQGALQAIQTKLQAMRDSANLGGQVRQEDVQMEGANNDIWNSFNQRTAQRQQQYGDNVANTMNEGDRFNVTNEQDIANRNTTNGNEYKKYNQGRDDRLKQATYDNTMGKVKVQAGISDGARQDIRDNTRDTNSAIAGVGQGAQTVLAYQQAQGDKVPPTQTSRITSDTRQTDPLNRKYV